MHRLSVLLLTAAAFALSACGSTEDEGTATQSQGEGQTQGQQQAGGSCGDVRVPGHIATELRAEGVACPRAAEVAAAALGKGRSAYEAAGLRCEPADAGGGDTNYTCTAQDARVTFRYGTA